VIARFRLLARFVPERRLAAAVAVAALLWLLPAPVGGWAGLTLLLALVLAVAVEALRLPNAATLLLSRESPTHVGLGDDEQMTYRVENRGGVGLTLRCRTDCRTACRAVSVARCIACRRMRPW
jgi:uncharacterized protein (DUF58 family)